MKYLILIPSLIAAMSCLAQSDNATIESLGDDILYRGYENKVTVRVNKNNSNEIKLIGANVVMKNGTNPNEYIVKPGNEGSIVTLHVLSVNSGHTDTLTSVNYRIYNLPVPDVYWGYSKSGGMGNITSENLSIKYLDGVDLPNDFRILSWQISAKDQTAKGMGNNLSSAEDFLKKVKSGTTLLFLLKVLSPDGITRMVSAQWEVNSWEEEVEMNPLGFDRN